MYRKWHRLFVYWFEAKRFKWSGGRIEEMYSIYAISWVTKILQNILSDCLACFEENIITALIHAVHLSTDSVIKSHIGSDCEDNGCSAAFGGAGTCVKLGSLSIDQLAQKFVTFFLETLLKNGKAWLFPGKKLLSQKLGQRDCRYDGSKAPLLGMCRDPTCVCLKHDISLRGKCKKKWEYCLYNHKYSLSSEAGRRRLKRQNVYIKTLF